MKGARDRSRIAAAIGAASDAVTEADLRAKASAHLLSGPHRFVPIAPSDRPASAELRLEGLVNLRLAITHVALDPLDVGEELARAAARTIAELDAEEREIVESCELDAEVALRYETSRFLDPPPPFTGAPLASPGADVLPALVARWEAHRERPEPFFPWLARKAKQHRQFYRIYLGFPLYAARMRRIHRALPRSIRQNAVAVETFSALEQLGPVLENFVFDLGWSASFVDATAVADYAFLYMQLADELVDNLLKIGGESGLRTLIDHHYAPAVRSTLFVPFEDLDDASLRRAGIDADESIQKYGVSVGALVVMLRELRDVLLAEIERTSSSRELREEVASFFRHCFATFLDEIELERLAGGTRLDLLPYASVAWHFHRKNHEVMTRWLVIRARILGLDPVEHAEALARWGVLLASFQIFDDMKDVAVDLGHQPCYPIELAHRFHPDELRWLEEDFGKRDRSLDRNEVTVIDVSMAATIRDCMRWSRLLALSSFDWFVDYVSDYRWRRNWLIRKRSFHLPAQVDVAIENGPLALHADVIDTGVPVVDAFFRYLAATHTRLCPTELDESTLGFVLDVVGYDHTPAIARAILPDVPTLYRFVNLRMRMSDAEKARIVRKLLGRHAAATTKGLVGLRRATGSSALVHRVARAIGASVPAPTVR